MRRRQNEELLLVIEREQTRESNRAAMLACEKSEKRRRQLENMFAIERRDAQARIEAAKQDNECVLVAHLTRLGFAK